MRFLPVPGTNVLFSVYETRSVEFAKFVQETKTPWIPPDAEVGEDYPAANVTWEDANAFCAWLTAREGKRRYRLPTDAEWSVAAGLGNESGSTPNEKGEQLRGFAWGTNWPPPAGAGNFAGMEAPVDQSEPGNFIPEWRDGYPRLAPVGKFRVSAKGLYDLSGNVLEWCADWSDARHQGRVARGGSWLNGDPDTLDLGHRATLPPKAGLDVTGFRCVMEETGG